MEVKGRKAQTKQGFSAQTSACLVANVEPSAFRFFTMPSTLLELNSLRTHMRFRWSRRSQISSIIRLPVDVRQVFFQDEGLVGVERALQGDGKVHRGRGRVRKLTAEGSHLVVVGLQNLRDVFCRRRLQLHQLLLQIWDLWDSTHSAASSVRWRES